MWLKQSTVVTIKFGPGLDKTDGVTPETGLATAMDNATTGIRVSKNGGNMADRNSATAPTHDEVGYYNVELSTTDTNTLGVLRIMFNGDTVNIPIWQDFMVLEASAYDALFAAAGTGHIECDAVQVGGQATSASGTVTFPNATLASTANITAGTITTVTNLTNAPTSGDLTATMKTSVNAEVDNALTVTTYAEPSKGAPGATVSLKDKIGFLYKAWRNKATQTATTYSLFNDDASTVDHDAAVSDDTATATRGEMTDGP